MTRLKTDQPILIVEDSDDAYEATIRAFNKTANLANPIYRCESGEDALHYLFRKGKYEKSEDSPRPGIVLLDLNMPGKDGRTVLAEIKNHPILKKIPVIVLSTSDDEKDIENCYKNGANTYIKKPVDLYGFFEAIKRLKEYWFEIAILPEVDKDDEETAA